MEKLNLQDRGGAAVVRGSASGECAEAKGNYFIQCVGVDGKLKWQDTAQNLVTTVGKNELLDKALAGSAYTVTGPYLVSVSKRGMSHKI